MMGFLESLGAGLRSAGGIMDEGVFKGQRQEELIQQQLMEKRKDMMAQQLIKGAESGAIPPEVAQQGLTQIGYKGMQVGPDATTQQRQAELSRRNAISKAFGGLAPEDRANPTKIAQIFMEQGDHAQGAKYLEAAEARQTRQQEVLARMEATERQDRQRSEDKALDRQSREEAAARADATKNLIAQGQQALQRDSLALRATIAQGQQAIQRDNQELRRTVTAQSGGGGKPPAGYRYKPDGSLEPIPGGPATKEGSKMPAELQRMTIGLNALETGLTAYEDALKDFNPRSTDQANMTKRAAISSLVADLRMQAKEAQALGALTGPDVAILDKALAEPASMKGAMYGRAGLTKQVAETRAAIKRRREGMASLKPGAQEAPVSNGWSIKEK